MLTRTRRIHPMPHRKVALNPGDDFRKVPIQRWADERAILVSISDHLRNARVRLDEMIAESTCGKSLGIETKSEDRERAASTACTKVDCLIRLAARLEHLTSRFYQLMSLGEVHCPSNSIDMGRPDLRRRTELVLSECARRMADWFDHSNDDQLVTEELESDLSNFELTFEAYAALVSLDQCQGTINNTAEKPRKVDEKDRTHEGRDQDLSHAFKEDLKTLQQVDLALRKLARCVAQARQDRFLQQYWREAECHYRELARQLTRRIGKEAIRIAQLSRTGGA